MLISPAREYIQFTFGSQNVNKQLIASKIDIMFFPEAHWSTRLTGRERVAHQGSFGSRNFYKHLQRFSILIFFDIHLSIN